MPRSPQQLSKLFTIRELSRRGEKRRASVVLEEKGSLREYIAFRDGELEIYDVTGRAKNQISLSKEEFLVLQEMEKQGARMLRV